MMGPGQMRGRRAWPAIADDNGAEHTAPVTVVARVCAARCWRRQAGHHGWHGSGGAFLVEVPVRGGAGDSQHFRDVAGRDALRPELTGFGGIGVVHLAWASALASPPFAAAAASPARVRSIMVSRSSWAKAAMMVSMAVPIGPSVCRPSVRLRNPIPRDVSWSTTARTCWVLRPRRSSFQTNVFETGG